MSLARYGKALVTKFLRRREDKDIVLNEKPIEELLASVRSKIRSAWNIHPGSTLHELDGHAMPLQALMEEAEVLSKKGSDYCSDTKRCRRRRENPLGTVHVIKMGRSNPAITSTPTTNASAMIKVESNPPWIQIPATQSTYGWNVSYVALVRFYRWSS